MSYDAQFNEHADADEQNKTQYNFFEYFLRDFVQ